MLGHSNIECLIEHLGVQKIESEEIKMSESKTNKIKLEWEEPDCGDDNDLYEIEWEFFCESLGELIRKKFKALSMKIQGENLGWRKLSGVAYLQIDESTSYQMGRQLFSKLHSGTECHVRVRTYKRGLEIAITHHDNPVGGDKFYCLPCAPSTVERNR